MLVKRTSIFTGITRELDLPITTAQINDYNSGTLIQNAFPNLNEDEREFIMTGATPEEWNDAYNKEEGEDLYEN